MRSHWGPAVLDLAKYFGAENLYVSVIESGSWDDTKGALRELDSALEALGVGRNIETQETTHENVTSRIQDPEEEGWIWTCRKRKELRRRLCCRLRTRFLLPATILRHIRTARYLRRRNRHNDVAVFSLPESRNAMISMSPAPVQSCLDRHGRFRRCAVLQRSACAV